jgi:hypothetical protein
LRTASGEIKARIHWTSFGSNGVEYDTSGMQLMVCGTGDADLENTPL